TVMGRNSTDTQERLRDKVQGGDQLPSPPACNVWFLGEDSNAGGERLGVRGDGVHIKLPPSPPTPLPPPPRSLRQQNRAGRRERGAIRRIWILVLAGTMGLSGATHAQEKGDNAKPEVKTVTVPFELLKTQHMVVEAKINGKGPYRLIFDTGAPVNLLNNKVAK